MPPEPPEAITAVDSDRSAELLRLVFDHAGEGISVFDAQMRLVAWNRRFLDCTGLPPALAAAGVPLLDLLREMARAGEFGEHGTREVEAEAQARLAQLRDGPASLTQRTRPNGRTLEMRRTPTPGGGFVMLYADVTERVGAQAALADEQRMMAVLRQATEQGFWFVDNAQRTTDANPAMCRMLALTRDELLGRSIFDFVDASSAETLQAQIGRRERGESGSYELTLVRADGQVVHCLNNATPIFDAGGRKRGTLGLLTDISALKRAEQRLRQTSALLATKSQVLGATLDSLAQGVLSIDAQGRINTWNRRALELLEVPEAVMLGCASFDELRRYQEAHGLIGLTNLSGPEALASGLDRPLQYQRTRRDGTVLEVRTHVSADGSVVRTYTDVTAAARAQEALAESESRFRTLADAAPALIWLSDADGRAIWFNQRWLAHTGRALSDELARHWPERMHVDDLDRCRDAFAAALASFAAYEVEYRLLCADGHHRWVADRGIPRRAADGDFDGFTVFGWDVTERRAAEAALRTAKEEAERANRAKSEFLSRMSHELRTPLNAVLGFAQLLECDTDNPLNATQHGRVQELMRGGRHLLALINDVLDLARIEAGALQLQLVPVNLAQLVDDCLPLVRAMADARGITLAVQPPPEAPGTPRAVKADATRLRQVLLNLLSNAIKYNRHGGHVTLSWRFEPDLQALRIEVEDTGPGISAAQQERLFQAFERLDADRTEVEGAGIGLALCKWLVDLMRGEIGLVSALGQGSRFWVRLGAGGAPEQAAAAAGAQALADAATAPKLPPASEQAGPVRTVLYIEDNLVNQLLMEGMLAQRPDVRLLVAGLPELGIAMAVQARPDLVLLDIQLPGIDGFEVLRRLRMQPATRQLPVVAVSANALQSDLDAARAAGFADYVTKPLELQRLLAVVDRMLDIRPL